MFVGDIVLDGPIRYYGSRQNSKYNDTFAKIAPIIRQADVAIGNLESPFGTEDMRKRPVRKHVGDSPFLLASHESAESLK